MAIILFYLSLCGLIVMMTIKYFGVSLFSHEKLNTIVDANEKHLHKIAKDSKKLASKIRFKNLHKLVIMIVAFIKRETILMKRKLDSKQPKFFLKPYKAEQGNKGAVSFFLKDISDYRDSLRRKDL